jgi:hypothetical protein
MPLPAPTYVKHIQTWVGGKVLDTSLFPMDPFTSAPSIPTTAQAASDPNYWLGKPSGFPQRFETEIKNMYKQMFRCYAHLYWLHQCCETLQLAQREGHGADAASRRRLGQAGRAAQG